jgi:hypothetical protein
MKCMYTFPLHIHVLPLHTSYMHSLHALRPAPTTPCSARHTTRAAVSIGGLHRSED